jgi:hypothetical protein
MKTFLLALLVSLDSATISASPQQLQPIPGQFSLYSENFGARADDFCAAMDDSQCFWQKNAFAPSFHC